MEIKVTIKQIYGVDKVYPVDDKAKLFAKLCSTTTLTVSTIEVIKQLGYRVLVVEREQASEL